MCVGDARAHKRPATRPFSKRTHRGGGVRGGRAGLSMMARVPDTVGLPRDRRSFLRCAAAAGWRVMRCGRGCPAGLAGVWAQRGWCVALSFSAATTAGGRRRRPARAAWAGAGGGVCAAVGASGCHPLAIRDCRGWPISGGKPAGGRRRRTGHGNVSAGRRAGRCLPYQSHTPACGRLAGERVSPSRSLLFSFFDHQPSLTLTGCASQRWGGTREVQRTGRASVSWTSCCERRDALRV